jgi:SagB-type dehydrogenase family enzyme
MGSLLFAAYGVTRSPSEGREICLRATPSAGGLYPLEVYLAVRSCTGLEPGLYHYDPLRHDLEVLGDAGAFEGAQRCLVQSEIVSTAAILIVTALFWRSRIKYGLRAYRFVLLEAGHLMQNVLLAAEALGLGALPLGGFFDGEVEALLGVDGVNESVVYAAAVGRQRETAGQPG